MSPLAVDVGSIVKAAWTSIVAGVVVTGTFCGALYGLARFDEKTSETTSPHAIGYLILGVVCLLGFAAVIVLGLIVMTNK